MEVLPPELLLYLIPFFPLTSLIAARGVSSQWRHLTERASLHPARKALLEVYLAAINHPNILSHAVTLQHREAYIADLTSRGCILPDVFELWVLEWPSKLVYFCAWPGIPGGCSINHGCAYVEGNLLSKMPIIETIPVSKNKATNYWETCLGLGLWGERFAYGVAYLWLVVDADKQNGRTGRLFWTYSDSNLSECTLRPFIDTPFKASSVIEFLSCESF